MAISRLGYASMYVMDVDAAARHYQEVVGLRLVETRDGVTYLQADDNQDHHCVVLHPSDSAGLESLGYKVTDPADLDEAEQAVAGRGLEHRRVPAGEVAGQGEGLRFQLPSGQWMVLYYHADKIGYGGGMTSPSPVPEHAKPGARVTHLDHVLISCESAEANIELLQEVFDFALTEYVKGPEGQTLAAFLSCGNTMHDLAMGPGPNGHFHHMAFGVESRADVIQGVDLLKEREVPSLEYGISRHGIAGVTTIYFHDPSGNRNEFFNGAYLVPGRPNEVPPIVWQPQHFPRGAFYYENDFPEAFFAEVT